jgi:hypothetical protein
MSYELTPEKLQGIAVKCAAAFLTKQASLSEAIAKEAQELELNPEQIKRSIEATNTVAYLRQLEDASDRTFEFPLADYKEVMAHMVLPEKQAAESEKDEDKEEDDKSKEKADDKSDSAKDEKKTESKDEDDEEDKKSPSFTQQEKVAMLTKETLRCVQVMEKIAFDKVGLQMELEAAAAKVAKDEKAFEKMAHILAPDEVTKLALLCGLEKQATFNSVFTDRELLDVTHLNDLYKQAVSLINEEANLVEFLNKSAAVLEKQALAGLAGQAIGASIRGATKLVTSPVKGVVKNYGKFSASAEAKGFKSTRDAAENFDKIKKTQGTAAAKKFYNGASPNIIHRKGIDGVVNVGLTATSGLAANHTTNVWDTLQKNN